jgi:hypothetical protein
MTFNDFVSETEAAELAGVSARTLLRFSESGYLTANLTLDGSRSYSRGQIVEIFGVPSTVAPHFSETRVTECVSASGAGTASSSPNNRDLPLTEESPRDKIVAAEPLPPTPQTPPLEEQTIASPTPQHEDIERLRNLIEMQERMLDAKDDEIADLRNQRAWLRERIEKLEEKSDRDQILLLQETQTIRQLIAVQDSRKSVVQHVLEWIGVTKSTEVATIPSNNDYSQKKASVGGSRTIEVEKAANQ